MYLPSPATKLILAAEATGSGEPRSARIARQPSIMHVVPTTAAASERTTEYQCSRPSSATSCGHSEYSPYPQKASTTASRPSRSHGLLTMRNSRVSTRTQYRFCHGFELVARKAG